MSGRLWIPEADDLRPTGESGTMDYPEAPPRVVLHTTECPSGGHNGDPNYWYWAMHRVLTSKAAEPTILWDPLTDKLGQYFPLDQSARALRNGSKRTNRVGRVCIQIEVVGYASRPFTRNWQPGPNFRALMNAIDSWRIPDKWPSGHPPAYPTGGDERSSAIWMSKGGWYGHSQVPDNYHGDPGGIDVRTFFGAQEADEPRTWAAWPAEFPGQAALGPGEGSKSPLNLLIKAALIAHGGYGRMGDTIDSSWDEKVEDRVRRFKENRGIEEKALVGRRTWAALGEMKPRDEVPDYPGHAKFKVGERSTESLVGQSLLVLQGFARPLDHVITREWRPRCRRAVRQFELSEPRLADDADGQWSRRSWRLAWNDND